MWGCGVWCNLQVYLLGALVLCALQDLRKKRKAITASTAANHHHYFVLLLATVPSPLNAPKPHRPGTALSIAGPTSSG